MPPRSKYVVSTAGFVLLAVVALVAVAALAVAIPALVFGVQSRDHRNNDDRHVDSELAELAAKLATDEKQLAQLKAQVAASGKKNGDPFSSSEAARRAARQVVADYQAGVASGAIKQPSTNEIKRALKKAGNPLIPEFQREPESDSGPGLEGKMGMAELNRQRAVALGLMGGQSARAKPVPADYDVDFDHDGVMDFAVVHMPYEAVVPPLPPTPFDLAPGTRLRYTRTGDFDYTLTRLADAPLLPHAGHTYLDFLEGGDAPGDDGYNHVWLAHSFPYNGTSWTDLYANSDGFVSFGDHQARGIHRTADRFFTDVPIIAALMVDLDPYWCNWGPGQGGFMYTDASKSVFTWNEVAHWPREETEGCPLNDHTTFQLILESNGDIEFRYGIVDTGIIAQDIFNTEATIGLGRGKGVSSPITYMDLSEVVSQSITIGTAVQPFQGEGSEFESIVSQVNMDKFYETHPDHFDILMTMHAGWGPVRTVLTDASPANFNQPLVTRTLGIGKEHYSTPGDFGGRTLESFVHLRDIDNRLSMSEQDMINPTIRKFRSSIWRDNTKIAWNFDEPIGMSPVSSPGYPYFIDLAGRGASSGYTHEQASSITGVAGHYGGGSSLFILALHELGHRWNTFHGLRHSNVSGWGDSFQDLLSRGSGGVGGAHPGTLGDLRMTYPGGSPFADTDADFAPKRPRGDVMAYSAGHITPLAVDPNNAERFIDTEDPSIVYPDTPDHDMAIADELCRAQGLDLFVTTPQASGGGLSTKSLAFSGIITHDSVATEEGFYVENARSPYAAVGFDIDLREISGLSRYAHQNYLFCGRKYVYQMDNTTRLEDVRASPQVVAELGPIHPVWNAVANGERAPLIGDEADSIDLDVKARHPHLYDRWNLDQCPLDSDANCNHPSPWGRYGARCNDVKTVGPVLWVKPGETATQKQLDTFGTFVGMMRKYTASHGLMGHGARGMEGDQCYLPKFDFTLEPLIH